MAGLFDSPDEIFSVLAGWATANITNRPPTGATDPTTPTTQEDK